MWKSPFAVLAITLSTVSFAAAQQAAPPTQPAPSEAQAAIASAQQANKFVYLFFWKEQNPQTDKAWALVKPALANMAEQAKLVSVQTTDAAEAALVTKYDVTRAPLPLVLAIAPCGAITKAFTREFDEAQLRAALVSPGTQLCMKALQDRKLVLLCVVDRVGPYTAASVPQGVQDFKSDPRFGPATEVVLLSGSDEAEATFLEGLKVEPQTAKPVTVFLAPPGSVIGSFDGSATKDHFAQKLTASQSNPCAGGQCGPNGCPPRK